MRRNSTAITSARPARILPMLIPALAAMLKVFCGAAVDVCGAGAGMIVAAAVIDDDESVDDDGEKEEEVEEKAELEDEVELDDEIDAEDESEAEDGEDKEGEAVADNDDDACEGADDEVVAAGSEPPLSRVTADRPQVCGSTASFDVMRKVGVLPQSSPARSSSCMWQMPLL